MNALQSQALWNLSAPLLAAMPRVGAAITVAPLFPSSVFTRLLRSTVVVSLSLFLYPHLAAHMPSAQSPLTWVALVGKEAFIGALIGFAVGTLIWALQSVGALIDLQIGLSNAQLFDPFGGHDSGPLSAFMVQLGVVLFVAAGGLQVLVSLLLESFHLWPVASFYPPIGARLAQLASESIGSIMELVVRLATPVILVLALIDLGFGLVNRVVPQLNVFYFTMPIKAAMATLMIAVDLSYLAEVVGGRTLELQHWLERLQPVFSLH